MASGSDKLEAVKQKPKYVDTLEQAVRTRYLEKVNLVGRDPYEIPASDWSYDVSLLPDVTYPDIVNYLVFQQSAYTVQQLKAYKSLEAYNYFVSGWVKEVRQRVDNGLCLVSGRVCHSVLLLCFVSTIRLMHVSHLTCNNGHSHQQSNYLYYEMEIKTTGLNSKEADSVTAEILR